MSYVHSNLIFPNVKFPIFIVSLDKDLMRRDALKNFLPNNIVENYFKAVDARSFTNDQINEFCDGYKLINDPTYGRSLNAGEVGCSLSHRKIYQYILDNNLPYALIFEDDVLPRSNWIDVLERSFELIDNTLPSEAVLIHLGLPYYRAVDSKRVLFYSDHRFMINPEFRLIDKEVGDKFWLTHSYIISAEAARRLLGMYPLITSACDDWQKFYSDGCFDSVYLSECGFDQNLSFHSNLRLNNMAESNISANNSLIIFVKNIFRPFWRIICFLNISEWVFLGLKSRK